MNCPHCNSSNTTWKSKAAKWECNDCETRFTPLASSPSLSDKATNPKKIFFSYGHDDNRWLVDKFKTDLEKRGHEVWIDYKEIGTWDDWRGRITQGIHDSGMAIAFLSIHSTRDPGVCRNEIAMALNHFGKIYPILVEDKSRVTIPPTIANIQWPDLSQWKSIWEGKVPEIDFERFYEEKLIEIVNKIEGEATRFAAEADILKKVLQPNSFDGRFAQYIDGFVGREWVFDAYEKWLDEQPDARIFWIKAGPGFGKSAMAVNLANRYRGSIIGTWFCDSQSEELSDPLRAIMTIAYQLAIRWDDYRTRLLPRMGLFEGSGDAQIGEVIQTLAKKNLHDLFSHLISEPLAGLIWREKKLVILIDALDEASDSEGKNALTSLISGRFLELPNWIGFVVTSRPDASVVGHLQRFKPFELSAEDQRNTKDLELYCHQRILTLPKLASLHSEEQKQVVSTLLEKSEGMFLYLRMIEEGLRTQGEIEVSDFATMEKGLTGLYSFYYRAFEARFPNYKETIQPLLRLVIAAPGPLPMGLAAEVLGWRKEETRSIRDKIGSYLEEGINGVRLFHKTLGEWLASEESIKYFTDAKEGRKTLADYLWNNFEKVKTLDYEKKRVSLWAKQMIEWLPMLLWNSENWEKLEALLTDLNYISYCAVHNRVNALLINYQEALKFLPETRDATKTEIKAEEARQKNISDYTRGLVEYAAAWRRIRGGSGEESPQLPNPVDSVKLWACETIAKERARFMNHMHREDLVRAFHRFVAINQGSLLRFDKENDFTATQASFEKPGNPVHVAGETYLKKREGIKIKRMFDESESYDPLDACIKVLDTHLGYIWDLKITPDGKSAIFAYGCEIRIYDIDSGELRQTLEGHTSNVRALALTPDGRYLVSASGEIDEDGMSQDINIIKWDLYLGAKNIFPPYDADQVSSIAVTPDGNTIVFSGSISFIFMVIDANKGDIIKNVCSDECITPRSVEISRDGRYVIVAVHGEGEGTVKIWDLNSDSEESYKTFLNDRDESNEIKSVVVSDDYEVMIFGCGGPNVFDIGGVKVWDIKSQTCITDYTGPGLFANAVCLSSDKKLIVSASDDNCVEVWSTETGKCLKVLQGHTGGVNYLAITPDCKRIVSASSDRSVRVWEIENKECTEVLKKSLYHALILAISPDRTKSIQFNCAEEIELVHLSSQKTVDIIGHSDDVKTAAFSLDGSRIITGGGTPSILKDDIENSSDYSLRLWYAETESERIESIRQFFGHTDSIASIAITPDGRIAVSGGEPSEENPMIIWDVSTGNSIHKLLAHQGCIKHIQVTPDGKYAITACEESTLLNEYDYKIRVWDIESGECKHVLNEHTGDVRDLLITPDGRKIVSGSADNSVRVWDIETGTCINELRGHFDGVNSLDITPDGNRIISASEDHTLRVWELDSNKCLYIVSFPFSPKIWNLTAKELEIDGNECFIATHENLVTGPLITTPIRQLRVDGLTAAPVTAFSPCCRHQIEISEEKSSRVLYWVGKEVRGKRLEGGFTDPALLLDCPSCKTKLRLNPFFVSKYEEINFL